MGYSSSENASEGSFEEDYKSGSDDEMVFQRRRGRPRKWPVGMTESDQRKVRRVDFTPYAPVYEPPPVKDYGLRTRRATTSEGQNLNEGRGRIKGALRAAMETNYEFMNNYPTLTWADFQLPEYVRVRNNKIWKEENKAKEKIF